MTMDGRRDMEQFEKQILDMLILPLQCLPYKSPTHQLRKTAALPGRSCVDDVTRHGGDGVTRARQDSVEWPHIMMTNDVVGCNCFVGVSLNSSILVTMLHHFDLKPNIPTFILKWKFNFVNSLLTIREIAVIR